MFFFSSAGSQMSFKRRYSRERQRWQIQENKVKSSKEKLGHHGRDHMLVGLTTTYATSAYHH
jgi:hypothetical protein